VGGSLGAGQDAGRGLEHNRGMPLRLLVKRIEVHEQHGQRYVFSAMLWEVDGAATRLVEWKDFAGTVQLGVWLAGVAGKYGRQNVSVDWTDHLRGDPRLVEILSGIFGLPPVS